MQKYEIENHGGRTVIVEMPAEYDGGIYEAKQVHELLSKLADKWEAEIAVAYNEYSQGQRAGLEQAAQELRASLGKEVK